MFLYWSLWPHSYLPLVRVTDCPLFPGATFPRSNVRRICTRSQLHLALRSRIIVFSLIPAWDMDDELCASKKYLDGKLGNVYVKTQKRSSLMRFSHSLISDVLKRRVSRWIKKDVKVTWLLTEVLPCHIERRDCVFSSPSLCLGMEVLPVFGEEIALAVMEWFRH